MPSIGGGEFWVFLGDFEAGQQEFQTVSDDQATAYSTSEPSFYGSYERALDDKGRFNVPFRFRKRDLAKEEEPPRFMIVEDTEGVVSLLTYGQYEDSMEQIMRMDEDDERDEFLRWMARHSQEVPMDSQGRVAVPARYLERIGAERRVQVLGMVNRMELQAPTGEGDDVKATTPPRKYFKRFFR